MANSQTSSYPAPHARFSPKADGVLLTKADFDFSFNSATVTEASHKKYGIEEGEYRFDESGFDVIKRKSVEALNLLSS